MGQVRVKRWVVAYLAFGWVAGAAELDAGAAEVDAGVIAAEEVEAPPIVTPELVPSFCQVSEPELLEQAALLEEALRSPRSFGQSAVDALRVDSNAIRERRQAAYCPSATPLVLANNSCIGAHLGIFADGTVRITPGADEEVSTWCLEGSGWGENILAAQWMSTQSPSQAACDTIATNVAFKFPQDGNFETAIVRVWSRGEPIELAAHQQKAAELASELLVSNYKMQVYAGWSAYLETAIQNPPKPAPKAKTKPPTIAALFERFKAMQRPDQNPIWEFARERALKQLEAGLPADADAALTGPGPARNRVSSYLSPGSAMAGSPAALSTAIRPSPERFEAVIRSLVLANQPLEDQVLPWTRVELRLPSSPGKKGALPLLRIASGAGTHSAPAERLYEDDELRLFAYNLKRGNDSASFLEGKRVEATLGAPQLGISALLQLTAKAIGLDLTTLLAAPAAGGMKLLRGAHPKCASLQDVCGAMLFGGDQCDKVISDAKAPAWRALCEAAQPARCTTSSLTVLRRANDLLSMKHRYAGKAKNDAIDEELKAFAKKMLSAFLGLDEPGKKRVSTEPLPTVSADPSAPYTSWVGTTGKLKGDNEYELRTCSTTPCNAATTVDQVTASLKFRTYIVRQPFAFTVDLGFQVPFGPGSWAGYAYEKIGSDDGPDVLWELKRRETAGSRLTFSTLLYFFPWAAGKTRSPGWEGLGIGVGPSLLEGDEAKLFRQWTIRLAYEPSVARGVIFGVGFAVRLINGPRYETVGGVVSTRTDTAPTFASDPFWKWAVSFGVSVDAKVFTDAVASLFKKKEEPAADKPEEPAATPAASTPATPSADAAKGAK